MTKEDLLYSISDIDDKYITEADRPYFGLMPRLMKYGSIAASFVIVITVSFMLVFQLILGGVMSDDGDSDSGNDMMSGDASGGSSDMNGSHGSGESVGGYYTVPGGTLRILDFDREICTATLTVTGAIEDLGIIALLEKNGVTYLSGTDTEDSADYPSLSAPIIRVNGEVTDTLPSVAGVYSLSVDFSALTLAGYEITELKIEPFGVINIE